MRERKPAQVAQVRLLLAALMIHSDLEPRDPEREPAVSLPCLSPRYPCLNRKIPFCTEPEERIQGSIR